MSDFHFPLEPHTPQREIGSTRRRVDELERRAHGPWHVVGATGEPAFGPTVSQSAGYVNTRFRKLLGGGSEIQVAVDGGAAGDLVFTLPDGYYLPAEGKIPLTGHDSSGTARAFYIDTSTGDVVIVL